VPPRRRAHIPKPYLRCRPFFGPVLHEPELMIGYHSTRLITVRKFVGSAVGNAGIVAPWNPRVLIFPLWWLKSNEPFAVILN